MSEQDRVFSWDDVITKDESEFTLIPEGEYDYTVERVERSDYAGGNKIPPCPKATIHIQVYDKDGDMIGKTSENLFLHSKQEWKLSEFFRSIGQKKHGEPLVMNWNEVPASSGRCKITVRKFEKQNGGTGESNNVTFLDPPEEDTSFEPGRYNQEDQKPSSTGWA